MLSIQNLPIELFLDIASLLPTDIDRQCLRIACRSFKRLIRPCAKPDFGDFSVMSPRLQAIKDHLDFVSRLSREGNIFHSPLQAERKVCSNCLRIQDEAQFSLRSLEINDHSVCDGCIGNLLRKTLSRGHKLNDTQRRCTYYTCASCGKGDGGFGMRLHCLGVEGRSTPLCTSCHMRVCNNTACTGRESHDAFRAVEIAVK